MAGKPTSNRWDLGNWSSGDQGVSLFQALGVTKGKIQFPPLQTVLTSAAAQSTPAPGNSSPGSQQSQGVSGTAPTNAKQYSYTQLEQLWQQAGGNPAYAKIAAAIAMAESGGNAGATSPANDVGLWQINKASWGSLATYDPLANAKAAVAISKNGTNWQPWVTYNSGAYKRFLQ